MFHDACWSFPRTRGSEGTKWRVRRTKRHRELPKSCAICLPEKQCQQCQQSLSWYVMVPTTKSQTLPGKTNMCQRIWLLSWDLGIGQGFSYEMTGYWSRYWRFRCGPQLHWVKLFSIRVCLKMLCTPLYPMVLLIIIPIKNGYNWEYTQHFQTKKIGDRIEPCFWLLVYMSVWL